MTFMNTTGVRIGFVALAAMSLTAGFSGNAVAKHGRRSRHVHSVSSHSRPCAQPVWQQPVRLGPMRYYGGPKSPMWRGPVEN
ncbi:hypothetical protein SAMN05444158_1524 [Bradyrhizobium canariense]|uniref:Uncharacterized protein n=1 Tax=Bradyrhizobium canariense TaxID=255045 RepID=A0A1H1QSX4_9BRAD|nr:hypothetical protein SAMN05444158_1524 [Bradyrhizobium canariense]